MNIRCDKRVDCGPGGPSVNGFDWPLTNYSAEDPDREVFIAENWGWDYTHEPPLGPDSIDPTCVVIATNSFSQQEADRCAMISQIFCANGETAVDAVEIPCEVVTSVVNPPPPKPPPRYPPKLVPNTEQTCTVTCPDGTQFSYTVAAGQFVATSQSQANAMAYSAACRQAELKRICGLPAPPCPHMICADEDWEYTLPGAARDGSTLTYSAEEGTLPPGLTLSTDGIVSGNPGTNYGEYVTPVTVTSASGATLIYNLWIRVWGLVQTTLSNGRLGFAYSQQLTVTGNIPGNSPQFLPWDPSALPPGITMDVNGLISGTPTTTGDFEFSFRIAGGCDGLCEYVRTISIYAKGNAPQTVTIPCSAGMVGSETATTPDSTYVGGPASRQEQLDAMALNSATNAANAKLVARGCTCVVTLPVTTDATQQILSSTCNQYVWIGSGYGVGGLGCPATGPCGGFGFWNTLGGVNIRSQCMALCGFSPGGTYGVWLGNVGACGLPAIPIRIGTVTFYPP